MPGSSPAELELTPDRLDYARRVALKGAPKHCGARVSYDDVAHDAVMHLMSSPPEFDPSRGAKPETLIYTIIHRAVIKYATREAAKVRRFRSFSTPSGGSPTVADGRTEKQVRSHQRLTGAGPTAQEAVDAAVGEMLRFINNEDSRALCRLFIECDGNRSEVARRLNLTEGAVRNRLKVLAPKLMAAGFDPLSGGGMT